jgi:predicted ArsR family transcriptional regulator
MRAEIKIKREQLHVLTNSTRLAIHTSLRTDGPSTAKELAKRLGCDEMSLYYHLRLMVKHGLLLTDSRPTATKPETVFEAPGPLVVDLDLTDQLNLKEVGRNVDSLMREASKEYRAAAQQFGNALFDQASVRRMAVRVSDAKREEFRRRLAELCTWLGAETDDSGERYSFTCAFTPLAK